MKIRLIAACVMIAALPACTSDEIAAISQGLAQGIDEASYQSSYYPPMGTAYSPYTPYAFSTYSGWPTGAAYGDYVGPYGCSGVGSFYTCDSTGDGYADMFGDTKDGSYSSANMRVNGRGEAYTWDGNCGCWDRERSLDGPRHDYHDHYYDYDDDYRHDRRRHHDDD